MAFDKVVDSAFLEAGLALVGDSIRAKSGTSAKLEFPNGMKAAVDAIDTSENLDEVLTEQESIIDQIQAALEGKAAASVETCTVVIRESGGADLVAFGATCFDGEVFYAEHACTLTEPYTVLPHTIANVVCGSILCISVGAVIPTISGPGVSSGYEVLYDYGGIACCQITANPGETATITIVEND